MGLSFNRGVGDGTGLREAGRTPTARRRSRAFRPAVEVAEDRVVLSPSTVPIAAKAVAPEVHSANTVYLTWLSSLLTSDTLAPASQARFVEQLDSGRSRGAVVRDLLRSREAGLLQAEGAYAIAFGRLPTAQEASRFADKVGRGVSLRSLYADLLGSDAFYNVRGGGTPEGFVAALYRAFLRREPTTSESSRWVGRLARRTPRSAVVTAIFDTPEAQSRWVEQSLQQAASWNTPAGLATARRIAAGPGGLTAMMMQVYGSNGFYNQTRGVPLVALTEAPPALTQDVVDHPPGLPLTPGLDFGTRWTTLPTEGGPTLDGTNLVAAGADGSVWATGGANARDVLYYLSPATSLKQPGWTLAARLAAPIISLSAYTAGLALLVDAQNHVSLVNGQGQVTPYGAPSYPDAVAQVSAGSDGTAMFLYNNGEVVIQPPGQNPNDFGYAHLPPNYALKSFSVGSGSNIWATATLNGNPVALRYNGAWQEDPSVPAGFTSLSAAADGTVWAWNATTINVRPTTTGVWQAIGSSLQTPPAALTYGQAASQFRLITVLGDRTLRMLSFGVADQPSVPTLPADPGQLAAYRAISQALGAVSPLGIRGDYPNALQLPNLARDYATLLAMAKPAEIPDVAWQVVKPQILLELQAVPQVSQLFDLLAQVRRGIESSNNTVLPGIVALVEANTDTFDGSDAVSVWIWAGIEAILSGTTAIAPEGTGFILSAFSSAFDSAVSALTATSNPDSDTKLDLQFSEITDTLSKLYILADARNAAYEQAILSDWSRLTAVVRAMNDPANPWVWDAGSAPVIADATKPGFEYMFLQALVPARWQAVNWLNYLCFNPALWNPYVCDGFLNAFAQSDPPSLYDVIVTTVDHDSEGHDINDYFWINETGGSQDITTPGPVPTGQLIDKILSLGVDKTDLFTGKGGWNLPTHVRDFGD